MVGRPLQEKLSAMARLLHIINRPPAAWHPPFTVHMHRSPHTYLKDIPPSPYLLYHPLSFVLASRRPRLCPYRSKPCHHHFRHTEGLPIFRRGLRCPWGIRGVAASRVMAATRVAAGEESSTTANQA